MPGDRRTVGLGRAVREVRLERGVSQEDLARLANVHRTYLGGVERGERNPSWESVANIASALGVPISELARRAEGFDDQIADDCRP